MNSEPIVREVEEAFHLSIPKQRIDALDKVLSQNPEISDNVVRDLIISTAVGIRVPNPKTNEPTEALTRIDVQLEEIWYYLRQVTAKTINFEPIDTILNQDRGTISLHVRWTYGEKISESTLFINFGNLETFAEFTDELYNKLNRSLHTNIIPYRLVFLDFGKMSRLACLPLSSARRLLEEEKLVFQEIYKDVRDDTEFPAVNDALVPTVNELLDGLKFHTATENTNFTVAEGQTEHTIEEIKTILALHSDDPEVKVEIKSGSFQKRPCDALPKGQSSGLQNSCELELTGEETKVFLIGDTSYKHIGRYLNAVLPETESGQKFFGIVNGYNSDEFLYVCCTENEFQQFEQFGYASAEAEFWQQNIEALTVPEALVEEEAENIPEENTSAIPEEIIEAKTAEVSEDIEQQAVEDLTNESPDLEVKTQDTKADQDDKADDGLPDDLLAAVIDEAPAVEIEEATQNKEPIIDFSPKKVLEEAKELEASKQAEEKETSVDVEMADELEKVLTAQLDAELGNIEETLESSGAPANSDENNKTEETKTA